MTTFGVEWTGPTERAEPRRVGIAPLLFGGVVVVALITRLVGWAAAPMGPLEASLASAAHALTQGHRPETWLDATQGTLTMLLFFLFGASDAIARVAPLAAGVGTLLLIWWARPLLAELLDRGAAGANDAADESLPAAFGERPATPVVDPAGSAAVAAAALLGLSALAADAARHLGGEAAAMALGLAVVLGWRRFSRAPGAGVLRLLAVVFAALLLAGAAGLQTGVLLLALALIAAFRAPAGPTAAALRSIVASRRAMAIWLVPFLATLGLLSTALLVFPGGAGLPSVGAWGARFEPEATPTGALYPLVVLLAYEPAILLLAAIGAWLVLRRRDRGAFGPGTFLVAWAGGEVLLAWLATNRSAGASAPALVPMSLLGGVAVGWLVDRAARAIERLNRIGEPGRDGDEEILPAGWRAVAIALIPLAAAIGFAYVVFGFFTQPGGLFKEFGLPAITIAAILLFGFLWTAARRLGRDAGAVLGLAAAALAMVASVHAMSSLNYANRPELARPAAASPEIEILAARIRDVADRLRGRPVTIAIDPTLRQPLGWYLRNLEGVSFVRQAQAGPTVVVLLNPAPPAPGRADPFAAYQSHRARLFNPTTDEIQSVTGWLRWWAFREGPVGTPSVIGYFNRQ